MKNKADSFYVRCIKRILDIVLSAFALLVLGIPMLLIAAAIRYDLGSPVLFTQDRIGRNEKKFRLYKYRSMKNAFDTYGVPLPDSQRLTKLGRLIRKLSIDELPSLLNIIKGDMSIVGPRPLPWNYKPWFKQEERIRHTVRGGLSGLAQVNGRNAIGWEEKFALDTEYVNNICFALDAKIVFQTFQKVFKRADIGERGKNKSHCDFHSYRSGLEERYLVAMEKKGLLPDTYEQWWGMTDEERKNRIPVVD